MRVIVKRVGHRPAIEEVENSLEAMQKLVGGHIETLTITSDCVLICDEEGFLKGKPLNCEVLGIKFCGDLVLAGRKRDEFTDVPAIEDILMDIFKE